jgi:hypothetical protein
MALFSSKLRRNVFVLGILFEAVQQRYTPAMAMSIGDQQ